MSKKRKSTPTTSNLETSPPITETPSETMDQMDQSSSSGVVQNSHEFIEENLKGALLDWLKGQTLYLSRTPSEQEKQQSVVEDLAEGLITVIKQTPESSGIDAALLEEIKKHIRKLPMDPKQKSDRNFNEELPTQILDHIKDLRLLQDISDRDDSKSEKNNPNVKKKATVVLLDDIANWIEKLPIETDDLEETRNIKEQVENKLVHKIGELNMNSEIFNDDFLYDDILGDHIENLLVDLPGQDIKSQLHVLKRELLGIVKKARKKIREENLGQIYKQQLYETISKTLPSLNLSVEGKASFEVLKDEVADAFINMRYISDGEEVRHLKKKINDEIYTFCNKYLKRCPASPLDTSKLNDALYKALKNVTEPENESFADDVELVKLKEVINDWTKQLPLKNQFGQEKLHTNKMVWILSKKIHDIETGKDFVSAEEYENNKKKEIEKFLTKLPLTTENDDDINEFVANILSILKDTEASRKRNSIGYNIQPMVTRASKAKLRISFNDVSVSPRSTDTLIQITNRCPEPSSCLVQKCSSVQTPCKTMQAKGSQVNVMPQVIVNEHVWDSIDESCSETPRALCPCPTPARPPYFVMPQPLQIPASTQGDETWTRPLPPSCPGSKTSRPVYEYTPSPSQNPLERRGSDSNQTSLKGCLTSRTYPLEPFQNRFKKPRDPAQFNPCCCGQSQIREPEPRPPPNYGYENYHGQLSENSSALRNERAYQAEKRCSNQSFVSVVEENTFQRANQNFSSDQVSRVPSSSPPHPFQLSTHPSMEPTSQYGTNLQNDQFSKQPCSCSGPGQNGLQENQYISCPRNPLPESQLGQLSSSSYTGWQFSGPRSLPQGPRQPLQYLGQPSQMPGQPPQYPEQPPQCPVQPSQRAGQPSQCPGRPPQFLGPPPICPGQESPCSRSSVMNPPHQEGHSANQYPFISHPSPHCHRGQPCMVPLNTHISPHSPSQRMPCAFNPRSPCYLRAQSSVPCDEYELLGPFQKSATRIGTLDDDDQICRPRFNDWNKVREDLEYWEGDRPNCISRAIHRRDRRCKMCRHRHGECNGRRF